MSKDKIAIGDEVMSNNHPKLNGHVIDFRDRTILGKEYTIYKVEGETGIEWINGMYLIKK